MCRCAESYVDTVSERTSYSPPPMTPTGTPNVVRSTSYHCRTEIERRGDDQRAAALVLDRQARDPGLAGARRQHDDAAALVRPPGGQRLRLVGPRLAVDARAERQLAVAAGAILDGVVAPAERAAHGRVGGRGRAETGGARVPETAGRHRRAGRQAGHLDRAASKLQGGEWATWTTWTRRLLREAATLSAEPRAVKQSIA